MPRLIVWHCDNCDRESRSESAGCLVVKQFGKDRPYFYSFCDWACLSKWLLNKHGNSKEVSNAKKEV
jgi:hypothetical protein